MDPSEASASVPTPTPAPAPIVRGAIRVRDFGTIGLFGSSSLSNEDTSESNQRSLQVSQPEIVASTSNSSPTVPKNKTNQMVNKNALPTFTFPPFYLSEKNQQENLLNQHTYSRNLMQSGIVHKNDSLKNILNQNYKTLNQKQINKNNVENTQKKNCFVFHRNNNRNFVQSNYNMGLPIVNSVTSCARVEETPDSAPVNNTKNILEDSQKKTFDEWDYKMRNQLLLSSAVINNINYKRKRKENNVKQPCKKAKIDIKLSQRCTVLLHRFDESKLIKGTLLNVNLPFSKGEVKNKNTKLKYKMPKNKLKSVCTYVIDNKTKVNLYEMQTKESSSAPNLTPTLDLNLTTLKVVDHNKNTNIYKTNNTIDHPIDLGNDVELIVTQNTNQSVSSRVIPVTTANNISSNLIKPIRNVTQNTVASSKFDPKETTSATPLLTHFAPLKTYNYSMPTSCVATRGNANQPITIPNSTSSLITIQTMPTNNLNKINHQMTVPNVSAPLVTIQSMPANSVSQKNQPRMKSNSILPLTNIHPIQTNNIVTKTIPNPTSSLAGIQPMPANTIGPPKNLYQQIVTSTAASFKPNYYLPSTSLDSYNTIESIGSSTITSSMVPLQTPASQRTAYQKITTPSPAANTNTPHPYLPYNVGVPIILQQNTSTKLVSKPLPTKNAVPTMISLPIISSTVNSTPGLKDCQSSHIDTTKSSTSAVTSHKINTPVTFNVRRVPPIVQFKSTLPTTSNNLENIKLIIQSTPDVTTSKGHQLSQMKIISKPSGLPLNSNLNTLPTNPDLPNNLQSLSNKLERVKNELQRKESVIMATKSPPTTRIQIPRTTVTEVKQYAAKRNKKEDETEVFNSQFERLSQLFEKKQNLTCLKCGNLVPTSYFWVHVQSQELLCKTCVIARETPTLKCNVTDLFRNILKVSEDLNSSDSESDELNEKINEILKTVNNSSLATKISIPKRRQINIIHSESDADSC